MMLFANSQEKPLIGITTAARPNWFVLACIKYAVRRAGGRPVRLAPGVNMNLVREINGLVISGGSDIDPSLYHQDNTHSVMIDRERDIFEKECTAMALSENIPMLGICRGGQMINVVAGGTPHQDAPSVFDGFIPTNSTFGKIFARRNISLEPNTRLSRILDGKSEVLVNSLHHQAHYAIGKGLRAVASDEQGIIQAIEGVHPDHFVLGVQWHPEFMLYSARQRRIFKALVVASYRTHERIPAKSGNRAAAQKRAFI